MGGFDPEDDEWEEEDEGIGGLMGFRSNQDLINLQEDDGD